MPLSKDLLLATLSMDWYNQGYGAGIERGETQIGVATAFDTPESIDQDSWQAAGFYAVAYEVQAGAWEELADGTTVIAIRGTDRFFGWTGSDIWKGWGIGAGAYGGDQARLGQVFFQAGPVFRACCKNRRTAARISGVSA